MATAGRASRLLGTKLKGTQVSGARVRRPVSLYGHASAGADLQADSSSSESSDEDVSPVGGSQPRAVRANARGRAVRGRGRGGGTQRKRAGNASRNRGGTIGDENTPGATRVDSSQVDPRALPVKHRRHQVTWTEVTPNALEVCSALDFTNEFLTKDFKSAARHAVRTAKEHLSHLHHNKTSYTPQDCAELLLQGTRVMCGAPVFCGLTAALFVLRPCVCLAGYSCELPPG